MEETPLGNKHLFSLEISIPKSHLPSLMCLTHNKIKTNIPQQFSLLALFTVTCHLTPCPQKWAVIAHLCTEISGHDTAPHQLEPFSGNSHISAGGIRNAAEANTEITLSRKAQNH